MSRHNATRKVVSQSLYDIESDLAPQIKRQPRTQRRYTSVSVKSSNVSPLHRDRPRRSTTRSRTSSHNQGDARVISLRDSRRKSQKQPSVRSTPASRSLSLDRLMNTARQRTARRKPTKHKVVWNPKTRARMFATILLIPFVLITLRLVDVQIIHSNKYSSLGVAQRRLIRDITPDRGTITDRNGNILAVSEPAYSVVADPSLIKDDKEVLRQLHKVTVFKDEDVAPLLKNKKSRYAMVSRHVDEPTANRVQKKGIPGISVIKDPKREYPSRDVAPNIVGFVGSEMNGLGGIEFMLDKELAGTKGQEVIERDPTGREIPSAQRNVEGAQRGKDVALTLDEGLQYEVQRVVLEEVAATGSKGGIAIIADVKTGEILAMVSVTGGPDKPVISSANDLNHAVTDVYEPGSTNKVITIAGALEEKLISPSTSYTVPDSITFDDKPFKDAESHPPEAMTVSDILRESSNVGTIMVATQLKRVKIDHYLRAFGFGSKTALNFPGEASGILLDVNNWSDTSIATVPTGNGLAVTPMQMLSVYMTIANDGVKASPRIINSFIDADGTREMFTPPASTRVISSHTALQLQSMLSGVVTDGTGKLAQVPGYSVAGKTGTARKPPYDKPPYRYMASFAGFAPANDPRLAAIVVLDEPTGAIYGGSVAAPVFARIMQSALRVFAIPPDNALSGQTVNNAPSITTTTTTTTTVPVPAN